MNLLTSIKQLWHQSKATPVFTALYVGGVTFAVAFTMLYAILIYTEVASVYPEYNRHSTLFLNSMQCGNDEKMMSMQSMIGGDFVSEHLSDLKNCDYITVTSMANLVFVQHPEKKTDLRRLLSQVDENFFKLYEYKFVAGEPFTRADVEADAKVTVISDRTATELFGSPEAAVGRDISVDGTQLRVRGVVKEGSSINSDSFSQIFVPLTLKTGNKADMRRFLGGYKVALKAPSPDKIPALKKEITERVSRLNAADTEGWSLEIKSMPSKVESAFGNSGTGSDTLLDILKPYLIVLLVLLVIPAMNISGMIGGQMNRRMAEIGVRRSFGANRGELCSQVMFENLVLTLVGGAFGLILVWIILFVAHTQILSVLVDTNMAFAFRLAPPEVSAEVLFAPAVFAATLIVCLILNVLSAYIPVRLALRRPIVTSLNNKR